MAFFGWRHSTMGREQVLSDGEEYPAPRVKTHCLKELAYRRRSGRRRRRAAAAPPQPRSNVVCLPLSPKRRENPRDAPELRRKRYSLLPSIPHCPRSRLSHCSPQPPLVPPHNLCTMQLAGAQRAQRAGAQLGAAACRTYVNPNARRVRLAALAAGSSAASSTTPPRTSAPGVDDATWQAFAEAVTGRFGFCEGA